MELRSVEDDALPDHAAQVAKGADVFERVALDEDHVRPHSRGNRAELALESRHPGGHERRRTKCLERSEPCANVELELEEYA